MLRTILDRLAPKAQSTCASAALLLLRVVAGSAFVLHGWMLIQHPFSWMGPQAPIPGFFQALAAIAEFGGGLAWIVGLLTPVATLGIGFTMIVAVLTHIVMMKDPFVNTTGGSSYELALIYLCVSVVILVFGAGKYSIDKLILGARK